MDYWSEWKEWKDIDLKIDDAYFYVDIEWLHPTKFKLNRVLIAVSGMVVDSLDVTDIISESLKSRLTEAVWSILDKNFGDEYLLYLTEKKFNDFLDTGKGPFIKTNQGFRLEE